MSFACAFFRLSDEDIADYAETYPGVNIEIELRKMDRWLRDNPTRRKNKYPRFICNWLAKTHGRLLEAQVASEAREFLREEMRRRDAQVGLWSGYK